jgi:hypothetical protein
MAADLERWLADEPVSAWPEPWPVKARRWTSKHRTLVTGVAAALMVGIVSLSVATVLLANANEVIRGKNKELADANAAIKKESEEKERQRALAVENHKKAEQRLDQSVDTLKLFANDARTYCEDAMVPDQSKKLLFDTVLHQLDRLADADVGKEFNEDKTRANIFLYETVALTDIELGRTVLAEPSLSKALKLADKWLSVKLDDPGALGRRAAVLHLFGVMNTRRLNADAADKYYRESLEIRQKLLGNQKVERFTPAKTISDLADSLDALERWDEAIQRREQAYEYVLKHIENNKGNADDAYFTLDGLNWTYQKAVEKTDDYTKKKAYMDKANETSVKLARLRPTGRVALERWAKNLHLYGDVEFQQGLRAELAKQDANAKQHFAEAKKQYDKLAEIVKQLTTSKDLLKHRRALAEARLDQGRIEKALGQQKKAEGHFRDCLLVREEVSRDYSFQMDSTQLKIDRLIPLALLGRHAEAAAEADTLRVKYTGKMVNYALARVYGLCSTAVTAEDKALQASYRIRALQCLEDAVRSGFDKWAEMQTEPDLAPLRSEPRFLKILEKEKIR